MGFIPCFQTLPGLVQLGLWKCSQDLGCLGGAFGCRTGILEIIL